MCVRCGVLILLPDAWQVFTFGGVFGFMLGAVIVMMWSWVDAQVHKDDDQATVKHQAIRFLDELPRTR
jgi:hypothetical protein